MILGGVLKSWKRLVTFFGLALALHHFGQLLYFRCRRLISGQVKYFRDSEKPGKTLSVTFSAFTFHGGARTW